MFTFLHAADLHLDSPLVGLERYDGAPVEALRGATRRALENLVDAALEERVAFALLVGDLFDGDWKDYNTGLFYASQMARLKVAGIPVFVVAGNHDAANQFTRSLREPDNVGRFSTSRPETKLLGELGVALHGRGFPTKSVTEDLTAGYPPPVPGHLNVGLLHTSLDGRPGHAAYAPCTLDALRARHYGYWALGHVHTREVVCRDPWVVFPGNPQGRHAREPGPKGCTLVDVEEGRVVRVRERPLDVLRWAHVRADVSVARDLDEALEPVTNALQEALSAADGRRIAVRVELRGATAAHGELHGDPRRVEEQVRALALDRCSDQAWIEKVVLSTTPTDASEVVGSSDAFALEACRSSLRSGPLGPDQLQELARSVAELRARLPVEALEPPDPTSPDALDAAVQDARELLLARLESGRGRG